MKSYGIPGIPMELRVIVCVCVCVCVCARVHERVLVDIKIKFKEKFDAFRMTQVRYQYIQKRLGHLVLGWRVTEEGELWHFSPAN